MKLLSQLILIFTLNFILLPPTLAQASFEDGKQAFQRGDFRQAAALWTSHFSQLPSSATPIQKKNHIKTSIYLAAAYQHLGQLKKALRVLLDAQLLATELDDLEQQAMVLSQLGEVYFALRDFGYQEIKALNEEFNLSIDPPTKQDMLNKANETFEEAKKLSPSNLLKAQILNGQGNVLMEQRKYQKAFEKYQEAEESLLLTQQRNDIYKTENECKNLQETLTQVLNYKIHKNQQVTEYNTRDALIAKIAVNLVQATEKLEQNREIYYTKALRKVTRLADSYDKVFSLLTLAQMKLPSIAELGKPSSQLSDEKKREESCQILATALKTAYHLEDKRSIAYALGYLARLYADTQDNDGKKRYDEAIQLTRQAIFDPRKISTNFHNDLQLLHTLKWQLGKLLRLKNQSTNVKTIENIYQQATTHFEEIKKKYRSVPSSFSSQGEKFFLDKADFLLEQAKDEENIQEKQEYLTNAIDSFELLKKVELQEYFEDYCVTQKGQEEQEEEQKKPLEKEFEKTAIFYILSFEDRVELLLSFFNDKTIEQKQVEISNNELTQQIEDFQIDLTQKLEDLQNKLITAPIQLKQETLKKLYEWLIKPVTGSLKEKEIETLVIVTHGTLRQMPFAAFYNGEENKYLIEEEYALVIAPSLQLTEFKIQKNSTPALLGGTNDFAINPKPDPLEHAEQEINYLTTEVFKDKKNENQKNVVSLPANKFTIEQIEESFSKHSFVIVHFSTHGNFSQQLDDTHILVYNKKLKLNDLEKLLRGVVDKEKEKAIARQNNSPSVELLTLSACETARGGEVGLAGTALKLGVSSVIASLWKVDDDSTKTLMEEFYRKWKNEKLSKAKALKAAQIQLRGGTFSEPYYWAPFLLIGNGF